MILVFLGSWRSTLIIAVSIPLSILASLIVLGALGETINIMTLGGLALAVGILVDDATVAIENINRNIAEGKEIVQCRFGRRRADRCARPGFHAFDLHRVRTDVFPHRRRQISVRSSRRGSRIRDAGLLSVVAHTSANDGKLHARRADWRGSSRGNLATRNPFVNIQAKFETGFERFRERYRQSLDTSIRHQKVFVILFFAACALSFGLLPVVGEDFFPSVDSGEFKLHVRAPTGTRIEDTADLCDRVENDIRQHIPSSELTTIIDNIGIPYSGLNLSYSTSAPIGPGDADIQVELAPKHRPTAQYVSELRSRLNHDFPGVNFYSVSVDIVSQILNFGLPAPVDIQVVGRKLTANRDFAVRLMNQLKFVPGAVDLRIQQPSNYPKFHIDVDRTKTNEVGFTQRDVASNLLISLGGSFQTSPTFWLDPNTRISYNVVTQTPQYRVDTLQDLENIPISNGTNKTPQILAGLASITPTGEMGSVSHYDIEPVIDIYGSVQGRDLGGVAREIAPIIDRSRKDLPEGSQLIVRGQIQTMNASFVGLLAGLGFSILLVYLLIVVNFQSWLDPFIILMALPAALAGIVWLLFVTGTSISVPALTGAIMCMGVATSNSILVVSFSKEKLEAGKLPAEAALEAGFTRFRPVLMTALAMIIGMLPMSLGVGEGGEQNAPLGRAVIGGLLFATVATLFFVPVFFSFIHGPGQKGFSAESSVPRPSA